MHGLKITVFNFNLDHQENRLDMKSYHAEHQSY
jgi:hypothetical protein